MTLAAVALDDKYALETGRVFMTGTQALVRLPMLQRRRDEAAGLKTGVFVSGYRGSPLGNYDRALWQARAFLARHDIHFQPGVNEDLAATAIWGTQQLGMLGPTQYDGVVGVWYGKGPGVDRCGDAIRHANSDGTARHGGVLMLLGDDHGAKSSTLPHQSDYAMVDAMIPVLHPAGVQEFLDLGLHGIAASRFSGLWVGFKCVTAIVDSSATVSVAPERVKTALPEDIALPRRRPQHPLARRPFRGRGAPSRSEARSRPRLCAAQPPRPVGVGYAGRAHRRRRLRQGVPRRHAGVRRPRDRRRHGASAGSAPLQGGARLATGAGRDPPLRRRPRRNCRRRREARPDRRPDQDDPLRRGRRAGGGGQARPGRGEPLPCGARTLARARGRGPRAPPRGARRGAPLEPPRPLRRTRAAADRGLESPAHPLFLLRLPAQHVDPGSRRQPRPFRHRLPLPRAVDGPQHRQLQPDGRRGSALDRPGAVFRRETRFHQYRRRHLFPFRPAGDPGRGRRRRQRHLQDPLQRRGGDDRRPAGGRQFERRADHPPTPWRGACAALSW